MPAQPWAEVTSDYLLTQLIYGMSHKSIWKSEQKPFSAPAGGGFYLRKDG
jgi:hypothetical protein